MGNKDSNEQNNHEIESFLNSNPFSISTHLPPSPMEPNLCEIETSNVVNFDLSSDNSVLSKFLNYGVIPNVVLHNVLTFCELSEVHHLSLTCKLFQSIANMNYFWKCYFLGYFPNDTSTNDKLQMRDAETNWKNEFFERYSQLKNEFYYRRKYVPFPKLSESLKNTEFRTKISSEYMITKLHIVIGNDLIFYDKKSLFYNLYKDNLYSPTIKDIKDRKKLKKYDERFYKNFLRTNGDCDLNYAYKQKKDYSKKYLKLPIRLLSIKKIDEYNNDVHLEDCLIVCFSFDSLESYAAVSKVFPNLGIAKLLVVGMKSELSEANREVKRDFLLEEMKVKDFEMVEVSTSPIVCGERRNLRKCVSMAIDCVIQARRKFI